ncbi:MAG: threonine--tRNA ligase [Christensenellaceae bacterium]|jgi:threonyl-tRNA synthetase|nr:threonine--tRNA ligase [Christensenellaceae bacterium]
MNITLPDGSLHEYQDGMTALQIAESISPRLAKATLAAELDGARIDAFAPIQGDHALKLLTFADENGRWAYRHTASHMLAQAVKRLYPAVKFAIGPAIENGFYYDFDTPEGFSFTAAELAALEKELANIAAENLTLERFELPRAEAVAYMQGREEPYKVELIEDLPEGAAISFYKQGEFVDLCAGPHVDSTGKIKNIKLLSVAGAYWRGSEKNKMLQRIYGTAFEKKADLDAYLAQLEEAKKRDHNKLGRELELFSTVDVVGQGLPILLPKGARVIQLLQRFVEDEEQRRGYLLTKTPLLAKRELYKISGHWDHYRDGMFVMGDAADLDDETKEVFALRPMTCPFQFMAYLNRPRSYRDLPLRYNETSTLFRNEASGEMHGLIRVRQFTISEGHLACRPDQVAEEFKGCLDLANYMLKTVGLEDDVSYQFSLWDENNTDKYIGDKASWEHTQNMMRSILIDLGIDFHEVAGEAAFYGPKLDIQIRNVHGKEDTLITIQIDFQLAERFGMTYTDSDGEKKHPVVIHRTSIGCYERTLALLIEKYAGALPTWMAPVQVKVLTITDRTDALAEQIRAELEKYGIRAESDLRNEKIGFKIREAQMQKVPYMLVLGDKEAETGVVAVRGRKAGDLGAMTLSDFRTKILEEIAERTHD